MKKKSRYLKIFFFASVLLYNNYSFSQITNTVIGVATFGANSNNDTLLLGQTIVVKMQTKDSLEKYNVLLINGLSVSGITVSRYNCNDNTIYFNLNENIRSFFSPLIKDGALNKITVSVKISVAKLSDKCTSNGEVDKYITLKPKVSTYWIWGIALIAVTLIILSLFNNLLKDDNNIYYSLGRTQLFFWTIIFLFSYLYIWFQTESLPDITSSILVILGISAGTTAASKLVDNQNALNNNATSIISVIPESGKVSEGFFPDILSDGVSINVHRFQNVLFNITFGIIFIQKAISSNILPEFDSNALLLMGISSATFAGLKATEVKNDQAQAKNEGDIINNTKVNENDETPAVG